jgi:TPR repeat protein
MKNQYTKLKIHNNLPDLKMIFPIRSSAYLPILLSLALSNGSILPTQAAGKKQLTTPAASLNKPKGKATSTAPARPIRDKWAVLIGIDSFKDPAIPHLKYAAKDAADFAKFLVEKGHFAKDHVLLLTNEKATRDNIRDAVGGNWLPRRAEADDLVLIFASTHGSPKELDVAGENFLVAYDSEAQNLYITGIRFADLAPEIKARTGCDRVVLLLDACNSGAANVGGKGLIRTKNFDVNALAGEGQVVISSSASDQRSFESKRYDNGVFTKQLMAALQTKGNKTTLSEAFKYLKERVETEVRFDRMLTQTPVMRSKWSGGELILIAVPAEPRQVEGETTLDYGKADKGQPDETYQEAIKLIDDKKYTQAFSLLKPAAASGLPYCQSLLGYLYMNGFGVQRNDEEAVEWFQKSADQGCAKGQNNLGAMYYRGSGVAQDYGKARLWYQKAAEQGYGTAWNNLGIMHRDAKGVGKDLSKAGEFFQKGAEQGAPEAQYNLALMYYQGNGYPQNYGLAVEWYQKAADQGYALAQSGLGFMYDRGYGVPQNYGKAVEWYEKAAIQGQAVAQNNMGVMYERGNGVPQNPGKAVEWYQKAADQGYAMSQNNLGVMYDRGTGVPKNPSKAVEWFQNAADQGNVEAQRNLGIHYRTGEGVPQNYEKSVEWLQKAANSGNPAAQSSLGFMHDRGFGVPQNDNKAAELYQKAADKGDLDSQNNIGVFYMTGRGVPKDLDKAREWLRKSAAQGHTTAKENLKILEQQQQRR